MEMKSVMDHHQLAPGRSNSLDERRRVALEEVDNAKLSWFHAKVCLTAGVG
jgi:PHS family inorganic phosphate transporter-like MFS transporter